MRELSLLVWLSRGNKNKLIELMCEYTGCEPEVYTDSQLIRLYEDALVDISRKYHLENLLYKYFSARRKYKEYAIFYPNKYTDSNAEVDALGTAILSIAICTFDLEDLQKLLELKKYLEVKNNG